MTTLDELKRRAVAARTPEEFIAVVDAARKLATQDFLATRPEAIAVADAYFVAHRLGISIVQALDLPEDVLMAISRYISANRRPPPDPTILSGP